MHEDNDTRKKESWGQRFLLKTFAPIVAPWTIKKTFGFDNKDVASIEEELSRAMAVVSFGGSLLTFTVGILFFLFTKIGVWEAGKTNFYTNAGIFTMIAVTGLSGILLGIDIFGKKRRPTLRVIGNTVFHLALGCSLIYFFVADLKNGDLSVGDSISAALGLLFILSICQPGRWQVALIVDAIVGLSIISSACYGLVVYNMRSFDQYVVFVFGYWIISYFFFSGFYYVEAQRYYIENRNADLYTRSIHDPLTGARNRAGLRNYLDERLNVWKAKHDTVLVSMLDIDDFKLYNDAFGHLKGDEVLVEIIKAIEARPDIHHLRIFRYGGEEFLLIRSRSNEEEAKEILEAVRKAVEDLRIPAPLGACYPYVTVSLGAALWTIDENYSVHDQIEAADQAVYEAKRTGKNKYVLHTKLIEPENPDQGSLLEEEKESA